MKRHQALFTASLSAVPLAYSGHTAEAESAQSQVERRQQKEQERYYASLTLVLSEDTVLAGIAMPKGATLKMPVNSSIFKPRIHGLTYPDSFPGLFSYPDDFWDVWKANAYAEKRLSFNRFELSASSFSLNLDDRSLYKFAGRVVKSRADCPLTPGSAVAWNQDRPDILGVYGQQPATPHCDKLHVEVRQELPFEVADSEMYLPLLVTGKPE